MSHQSSFEPVYLKLNGWVAMLTLASIAFSLGFACATPFAAFAAAAALSLPRRHALWLVFLTWVANQAVGYTLLGYPQTANSFGWGAAIGGAAMFSVYVARAFQYGNTSANAGVQAIVTLAISVLAYQVVMALAALTPLGGYQNTNVEMISRIVLIDVIAFAGLTAATALAVKLGFIPAQLATVAVKR